MRDAARRARACTTVTYLLGGGGGEGRWDEDNEGVNQVQTAGHVCMDGEEQRC